MRRAEIPVVVGEGQNMSNGSENLALTVRNRQAGYNYGVPASNYSSDRNRMHSVPRPLAHQPDEGGGTQDRWSLFEERVRTGPFGLTRFPSQPHSPIRVLIVDDRSRQLVNPRLQQFIRDSPPRIRGQWQMDHGEEPGLSEEDFKRAMSKLRRHIFSPTYPRKRAFKRGLFSRIKNNHNNHVDEDEEDDDDDGRECTICLDEFVPNQQVLMTPCNHMFHKECIVPWVKGHGKCPVCRFVLAERRELARNTTTNNNTDETMDLISLIRAMEEAYAWVDVPHH